MSARARTAVWYLNNNAFVAGTYAPTLPAGWRVVGVADFNGDSQARLLALQCQHTPNSDLVFVGSDLYWRGLWPEAFPVVGSW